MRNTSFRLDGSFCFVMYQINKAREIRPKPGIAAPLNRKKLDVRREPQATCVEKAPEGERNGCISIVVVAVEPPPGENTKRKLDQRVCTALGDAARPDQR